jgi:hypothetical protein
MDYSVFEKKDFDWQQFIGKPYHKFYSDKKKMAYNKFNTLQEAVEKLNLTVKYVKSIVDESTPFSPSDLLKVNLERGTPLATKISTEKASSELIISPILMEIVQIRKGEINYFSGIDFRVDAKRGLNGRCDFLLGQGEQFDDLTAPVLAVVEAKKNNTKTGLGQCAAEMYASQVFNKDKNKSVTVIFGSVTNGINWRFLKLEENTLFIEELDRSYNFEKNLDELLGMLLKLTQPQH